MLIPVLMYHDIQSDLFDLLLSLPVNRPYVQKISDFKKQIEYLRKSGFKSISVSETEALSKNDSDRKTVIITFDDGDSSNYNHAFRILIENNFKATFFITTDFINKPNMISWDQLKEMHSKGMEIGSHTVTHPIPSQLNDTQLFFELSESKKIIEKGLGHKIKSFSLPTGYYNPKIKQLALKAGYSFVCTSQTGIYDQIKDDPYAIKRIAIKRTTDIKEFIEYVECNKIRILQKKTMEKSKRLVQKIFGVQFYEEIREYILSLKRK